MSLAVLLGVGALGGVGAVARLLVDAAVSERVGTAFPWGTLAVNATGAFALGVVGTSTLVATGLIGGYTTFSTWMLETHRLGEDGRFALGVLNIVVSLAVGIAAAALGRAL
jgi:fluoride exporter